MINSVNGKKESMDAIFPIVKKYGGVVVGLTLDENGIPETAEKRFDIAQKIINTAQSYGISKKDIIIDVLAMTISSDQFSALETLKALHMVKQQLGVKTIRCIQYFIWVASKRNYYISFLHYGDAIWT